jgi:hypothetical protein
VSPLTRAIETAVGAFGGAVPAPLGDGPLLMLPQEAVEGVRPARPGVSAAGVPPFVACELCREHLGVHPCDRRRDLAHYKARYPAVDWSNIDSEKVRRAPRAGQPGGRACADGARRTGGLFASALGLGRKGHAVDGGRARVGRAPGAALRRVPALADGAPGAAHCSGDAQQLAVRHVRALRRRVLRGARPRLFARALHAVCGHDERSLTRRPAALSRRTLR